MANKMRPVHPGEILRDELNELGLSANALAKALGVPDVQVQRARLSEPYRLLDPPSAEAGKSDHLDAPGEHQFVRRLPYPF